MNNKSYFTINFIVLSMFAMANLSHAAGTRNNPSSLGGAGGAAGAGSAAIAAAAALTLSSGASRTSPST